MRQSDTRGLQTRRRVGVPCVAGAFLVLLPLVLLPVGGPLGLVSCRDAQADPVDRDRDLEPPPPWIFFDQPDPKTDEEIRRTLERSFADQNLVVRARAILVRRFGVLSAPMLLEVLAANDVEPFTWNAALTVSALRSRWGNARELWPLLPPLLELADEASEPYRRAFASLALGTYRSIAFAPPPERSDPLLVRNPAVEARNSLRELLPVLGRHVDDAHPHVRVAVALALGKTGGGSEARALLNDKERLGESDLRDSAVKPRQAVLLAIGLLPGQDDEPIFLRALQDEERHIRQSAALALSLQALRDVQPGWTHAPRKILRALKSVHITPHLEDGAEAVFTRGVLAALGLAPGEWRTLFDLAGQPSTEETAARSAAQALLFCKEPWFLHRAHVSVEQGVTLDPVVLAALLLRIGTEASPEGIGILAKFLSSNTKNPRGKEGWDVRFFAAVGLLRALAAGPEADPARRESILNALTEGVKRGLRPSPFRDALKYLLSREQRALGEKSTYVLPEARVTKVEQSFHDPHGLFARDLQDMVIVRLNDMVPVVFNVNNLKPGQPGNREKSEMPRRFLKAVQEHFPYFTRLDLLSARGLRPPVEMPEGSDKHDEVRPR